MIPLEPSLTLLEPALASKEAALRAIVRELESCVVAFSGGVDSALVLHVTTEELGERAFGVTAQSASFPEREREAALLVAGRSNAQHALIETDELANPAYAANPENRCYFCKRELYGRLSEIARERGTRHIVDGYHCDDDGDVRPGRTAAREFGVRSPLHEAGFGKDDVRALARKLGLDVWDKPALACLSSRFPHGTPITLELLCRVDAAERAVLDAGLPAVRVRHHGDVARIEVPREAIALAAEPERRERIVAGVRAAGYRFVALDLGGYVSGNLNPKG